MRNEGGGFAAQKEANPASLCSAAPSKGRGSRGHSLLPMEGGAPKGRRLDGESGMKKSGKDRLKSTIYESTLSTADAVPLPQWGRLRYESNAIPETKPSPRGEGKEEAASPPKRKPTPPRCARQPLPREGARVDSPSFLWKEGECRFPALSFRAKARNLFRSRSGKGCEDSGEQEAPCFLRIRRTVFHADSITKENGNGKRKRSLGCARDDETRERLFPFLFNLLRKPTPPRCARQPLPREGARVDTPSFLWKEVPRRGGGWRGKAV